jgi:hypothetical protein
MMHYVFRIVLFFVSKRAASDVVAGRGQPLLLAHN